MICQSSQWRPYPVVLEKNGATLEIALGGAQTGLKELDAAAEEMSILWDTIDDGNHFSMRFEPENSREKLVVLPACTSESKIASENIHCLTNGSK